MYNLQIIYNKELGVRFHVLIQLFKYLLRSRASIQFITQHVVSFNVNCIIHSRNTNIHYISTIYATDASSHRIFPAGKNCQRKVDHSYSLLAVELLRERI